MARKSKALRLSQSIETLEKYKEASEEWCTEARFLKDMIDRQTTGRTLSTRQRSWLDSIITEGGPKQKDVTPENATLIAEIKEALTVPNTEDMQEILGQFHKRLELGRNLSEKQLAWCRKLLERIGVIKEQGRYMPDNETRRRIELAVSCSNCYNPMHWHNRPGSQKALTHARNWLVGDERFIDEWQVQRLFKSVKGAIDAMENPRFLEGQMCYVPSREGLKVGIVLSGPYVYRKDHKCFVAYDVFVDSKKETYYGKKIRKRR